MLKDVIFCGKIEAAAEPARSDWAVISIGERDSEPVQLRSGWHSVLRLNFHDIDIYDEVAEYDLFNAAQARRIIEFVDSVEQAGAVGILVHCKAGISRSAAVAKWICESRQLPFNMGYMLYNRHVYTTLRQAANRPIDELVDEPVFIDWTCQRHGETVTYSIRHVSDLVYRSGFKVPVWSLRDSNLRLVRYDDLPADLVAAFREWQTLAACPAFGSAYWYDFRDFMDMNGRGWYGDFSAIVGKYTLK